MIGLSWVQLLNKCLMKGSNKLEKIFLFSVLKVRKHRIDPRIDPIGDLTQVCVGATEIKKMGDP